MYLGRGCRNMKELNKKKIDSSYRVTSHYIKNSSIVSLTDIINHNICKNAYITNMASESLFIPVSQLGLSQLIPHA